MLQVASEATPLAYNSAPNPPRAASRSDNAPNTPFERLLDDSAQATAQPPAPPAPTDKNTDDAPPAAPGKSANPAPAASSQSAQENHSDTAQPSDSNPVADQNPPQQNKGDVVDPTVAVKNSIALATNGKAIADITDTKAKAAGKIESSKVRDASKPTDGAKQPVAQTNVTNSPAQAAIPLPTVGLAPTSVAVTPSTSSNNLPPPESTQALALTDSQAKLKLGDVAGTQNDGDKPATPMQAQAPAAFHASVQAPTIAADTQSAGTKVTDASLQPSALVASPSVSTAALNSPTAPATTASPAPTAPAVAVPVAGVAVEIAGMALAGKNHFEIRLDPPELGRIEVRLDVDKDGHVTSRLIADRADTLNLLRSDASGLERALQDAGLKTADNGLQFSLRDQSAGQQQQAAPSNQSATQLVVQDTALATNAASQSNYSRLASLRGGIDIRV